jgi:hypothetical protein
VITPWQLEQAESTMRNMNHINTPSELHSNHDGSCCQTNHDEIARAAFSLYERQGSRNGQDVRHWLDAETHLKSMRATTVHGILPIAMETDPSVWR